MKIRTAMLLLLSSALFGQAGHQANVNSNGDRVMGFSHEKTTHHFLLTRNGGVIEALANDASDATSRRQIQQHFQHIAVMFAGGNFDAPMLVHSQKVPGTEAMTQWKESIHWHLENTAQGARLNIVADNRAALKAVHEFLRFQIKDHHTGDPKQPGGLGSPKP